VTRPPASVADVIAGLRRLGAGGDGVACFARLYLAVTEGVEARLGSVALADSLFLARLDVAFAALFFAALEAHGHDPQTAPRAWAPLFEARSRRGIAPLQFALAGMNAHINRDLPVALAATWDEPGYDHADYLRVNPILAEVEARAKASLVTGWLGRLDRLFHRFSRLDDVAAMWNVERARDAAWTNGLALRALRDDPGLAGAFLATLDRTVGLAGRGLLRPL
jgi:hypothetical protein